MFHSILLWPIMFSCAAMNVGVHRANQSFIDTATKNVSTALGRNAATQNALFNVVRLGPFAKIDKSAYSAVRWISGPLSQVQQE